jgi:hypothetical protein
MFLVVCYANPSSNTNYIFYSFSLEEFAMTLGMPWLPESCSNDQVLEFLCFMWRQWLLKFARSNVECNDVPRDQHHQQMLLLLRRMLYLYWMTMLMLVAGNQPDNACRNVSTG